MKRPCKIAITCEGIGPQPEPDWPVTNYSAEAPDPLVFADIVYPGIGIDPQGCFYTRDCPSFTANGCYGVVYSAESQETADTLAAASMLNCPPPFPPGTGRIYANDERTATARCPNGTSFTYTVLAGTLVSPLLDDIFGPAWQEMANDWAESYALQKVSELMSCIEPPPRRRRIPGHGPTLLDNPTQICFGESIDPDQCSYSVTGPGSGADYNFSIVDGSLPAGTELVKVDHNTAVIQGTPTECGNFPFTVRATRSDLPYIVLEVPDYLIVFGITTPSPLPDAHCDKPYSVQLVAEGGNAPYLFSVNPDSSMPPGLTLDTNGLIHGTPTSCPAVFSFAIDVEDSSTEDIGGPFHCTYDFSLTLRGPKITNAPGDGVECSPYGPFQFTSCPSGCTFSGSFPADLTMTSAGLVSGTPRVRGTVSATVTATDPEGNSNTYTFTFDIASIVGDTTEFPGGSGILYQRCKSIEDLGNWRESDGQLHGALPGGKGVIGSPAHSENEGIITVTIERNIVTPQRFYCVNFINRCSAPSFQIQAVLNWTLSDSGSGDFVQIDCLAAGSSISAWAVHKTVNGSASGVATVDGTVREMRLWVDFTQVGADPNNHTATVSVQFTEI